MSPKEEPISTSYAWREGETRVWDKSASRLPKRNQTSLFIPFGESLGGGSTFRKTAYFRNTRFTQNVPRYPSALTITTAPTGSPTSR